MLEGDTAAPVAQDPKILGRHIFMANCAACHQVTGLGLPGAYPPLAGSEWAKGPYERIVRIVLGGLSGPITVKGTSFNSSMPSLGQSLRDVQLAAVLTYIRSEWDNNAPAVSSEKVKEIRASVGTRAGPWSPEELLKIP
jgi:mono/diheme cytochrome c family protein